MLFELQTLYWVDFSLPSHLPELAHDLFKNFKLDTLPGGTRCLHHFTPVEGRPFLVIDQLLGCLLLLYCLFFIVLREVRVELCCGIFQLLIGAVPGV